MVIGDPGRFRQIITNLMGNSIKFTEKGHIFVTVHLVTEVAGSVEENIESSSSNTLSGLPVADRRKSWVGFKTFDKEGGRSDFPPSSTDQVHIVVSVEDTGSGIPLEAQPRIFTPFMQVGPAISRTHGGTGIGLSISKCLVHLMQGEIGFASVPKIGSTFTFTAVFSSHFCNSNELPSQQISKQSSSVSSEFQGMRALVVDPRPLRAKVSKYHIQRLGIHVEVCPDMNHALSTLNTESAPSDMVLVEQNVWDKDLYMSNTIFHKIKVIKQNNVPKLFLLTNYIKSNRASVSADGLSIPGIVTKPLRASMLAASLQRAMGRGTGRNGDVCNLTLSSLLHGSKILVVDDNKVNLKVAEGFLKKYGAEVVRVESGKEAVLLLQPPHKFDACFMDIQMPEMDGFEATKKIRNTESEINSQLERGEVSVEEEYANISKWHIPVLAMTADVIQATNEECQNCGMDGYVSKPFEAEQLYHEVSRFFETARKQFL